MDHEHTLVAVYPDARTAREAYDLLQRNGFGDEEIQLSEQEDEAVAMQKETEEESDELVFGPGVIITKKTAKSGIFYGALGTIGGLLLGAVVWAIWVAVDSETLSPGVWAIIFLLAGGVAGVTAGSLIGAFREARHEKHKQDVEGTMRVVLGVHTDDPARFARAESILRETYPRRIERDRRESA